MTIYQILRLKLQKQANNKNVCIGTTNFCNELYKADYIYIDYFGTIFRIFI